MIGRLLIVLIVGLSLQFALNISENFDLVTTRVLIPVLFLLWLVRGLAQKKIWISNKAEMWLVTSFLFLSTISLAFGRDASTGIRKLLYFLTVFPVFFIAADVFQDEKWRRWGAIAVITSGFLASVTALVQFFLPFFWGLGKAVTIWENLTSFFLGNSFGRLVATNSSWLVNISGQTQMRAFGFFPDPHNFAFFMNLCVFVDLGYFFCKNNFSAKSLASVSIPVMLIAVAFSYSRGAYLGLAAGLLFFAVIFLKRTRIFGKAAVVGGAILIVVFLLNSNLIFQRLASSFNLREGSNAERYKNWAQATEIIRNYPFSGVGLGNYAQTVDPAAGKRSSIYAHNLFLDIAAETGILNAFVFLFLILISVWRNVRDGSTLNLGLAAGLVGFLTHSIFDTALYSPQVLTLSLVIIALGMSENSKFKIRSSK